MGKERELSEQEDWFICIDNSTNMKFVKQQTLDSFVYALRSIHNIWSLGS
jgi:hypothetical protein